MPIQTEKRRVIRARYAARKRGFVLLRNRSNDTELPNHGGFMLVDEEYGAVVSGGSPIPFFLSLDEVEAELDLAESAARFNVGDAERHSPGLAGP